MASNKKVKLEEKDSVKEITTEKENQKMEKIYASFWQR